MKNPLEIVISMIAPHCCVSCGVKGKLLCESCAGALLTHPPSRCYRCHKTTRQSQTCRDCRRKSSAMHVWVAANYEEIAKGLVYKLKFDRANAAADVLAREISEHLPDLPTSIIVTHVPTANKRVRRRGYDQSKLIARSLAEIRGWRYAELLQRKGSSRQVGSSRSKRLTQLEGAFMSVGTNMQGAHILLVDDVLTTGATIETAGKTLKNAGAKIVDAAVFSQPID